MTNQPIRCGRCRTKAIVVMQGTNPISVNCPKCGESQTHSAFQQSLGEQMTAHAQKVNGGSFAKMARDNKNITYKPGRIRRSKPKFTVGF